MEKISIIVPVYNAEKFLHRCIDSLVNQNYNNLEIILVNDGSNDSSKDICESYKKIDLRIVVIDQINQGQSVARNIGIQAATGQFICFVDSDDYVNKDYVSYLYKLLKDSESDISICGFKYCYDYNDDNEYSANPLSENTLIEGHDIILKMHTSLYEQYVVVWGKLFKKSLFDNIQFPAGRIWEDYYVLYQIFYNCKRVIQTEKTLYYYYRNNNASATFILKKKYYDDMRYVLTGEISYMEQRNEEYIIVLIKKKYIYWVMDYYIKNRKIIKKSEKKELIMEFRTLFESISKYIGERNFKLFYKIPEVYSILKNVELFIKQNK